MEARTPRILVIDDDPSLCRMLRLSLLTAGFDVVASTSAEQGLREVETSDVNAVVLDLQMPVMDGRTFYHRLRSQGHGMPVVIVSAYGAEAAKRELGATAALAKPFDPTVLIGLVQESLDSANGASNDGHADGRRA